MKTFAEKINVLVQKGYLEDAARAKVAHDAVLMAMRKAGFESSSTIKGGVVMSHITADIRRLAGGDWRLVVAEGMKR